MKKIVFPSHKETLSFIETLNTENWEEYNGSNIDKYLKETHLQMTNICKVYSAFFLRTPQPNPFKFKFFRARKCDEIRNKNLRCEYSYPPIAFAKENLRANLIGAPVLYLADHPLIAVLEIIKDIDNTNEYLNKDFVISNWNVRSNQRLFLAPFIPKSVENVNEYSVLGQFSNDEYRQKLNIKISDDEIEGIRTMKEYFSNLFINDNNRSISSYLGHYYSYKFHHGHNMFIYPSKKAKHSRINFTVNPNFADEMMEISHIYRIRINSKIETDEIQMKVNFSLIDIAFNENTKIKWKEIKNVDPYAEFLFAKDFEQKLNKSKSM